MEQVGVEEKFRLSYHLKGTEGTPQQFIYNKPFMQAVELIKKLHEDKALSPIQKMELIQSINKSITREVDLYYQRNTASLLPFTDLLDRIPSVKANKIVLDAD